MIQNTNVEEKSRGFLKRSIRWCEYPIKRTNGGDPNHLENWDDPPSTWLVNQVERIKPKKSMGFFQL